MGHRQPPSAAEEGKKEKKRDPPSKRVRSFFLGLFRVIRVISINGFIFEVIQQTRLRNANWHNAEPSAYTRAKEAASKASSLDSGDDR